MGTIFGAVAKKKGASGEGVPVPSMRTVETNKRAPRKSKTDHILLIPGAGTFFCSHCGEKYTPTYPIAIPLMSALSKAFERTHKACRRGERGVACTYCLAFGHEAEACPRLSYGDDPERWWNGPDTGMSSRTIWRVMMGHPLVEGVFAPADPSDFGRCHRLLHAIPGWRARIGEMAKVPGWERLAPAWDELEALYLEGLTKGRAPKLYDRIDELTRVVPQSSDARKETP